MSTSRENTSKVSKIVLKKGFKVATANQVGYSSLDVRTIRPKGNLELGG